MLTPKALAFLYQLPQFPEKHLCGPSRLENLGSQSGQKFLISITVLAFHKDNISSIPISTLHTCVLFIIFSSVSKLKCDLSDKIFVENQLAIKTNQLTDS